MRREIITDKQRIYLVIIFVLGTATILVRGIEAKQDLWIATILAILMGLTMCLIFGRLNYLLPNKDLVDILVFCYGKLIGKIIGILYIWFALHLNALILAYINYIFTTLTFTETPGIVFTVPCVLIGIYAIKLGIEVLARWSEFFLHILIVIIVIFVSLLVPQMNIDNMLPMITGEIMPIVKGTLSAFSFPFGEIVIFTMIFSTFTTRKSSYKVYTTGLLISGIILFVLGMSYLLVLGLYDASSQYFPANLAASRILLFQRSEIVVLILFTIGSFAKFCLCLLAACIGTRKVFGTKDYRFAVVPIALIMFNLAIFLHKGVIDWIEWAANAWPPYAFIFQALIPTFTLVVAEIKSRIKKTV